MGGRTSFDEAAAARLKMRHAISCADAFAATAATAAKAILVTGDPELAQLANLLPMEKLDRQCGTKRTLNLGG